MARQVVSQTGTGSSAWLPIDWKQPSFAVGMGVAISGTVTYTVEHTFDDVLTGAAATVYPHSTLAGLSANADGNYAFPVTAVRITVNSGTGTASLTLLQGR